MDGWYHNTGAVAASTQAIQNHAAFIWSVADLLRGDYAESHFETVIITTRDGQPRRGGAR
jgi:hypothetical protein